MYPTGYIWNPSSHLSKKSRKKHGLSQEELAFKAGVGLCFLRELERGKTTVQLDKVNEVLNMFGKQVGVIDQERGHDE